MAASSTPPRSKEHHVAVGLGFWASFKNGDIDACAEMLHPDVEWYPNPRLQAHEAVRGRERVRDMIKALHARWGDSLDVLPEDGRQIENHVLMVTVLSGENEFTKQTVKTRECWVVTIRDDRWARIVTYPNAPAARLGFEELVRTAGPATKPASETPGGVTLAAAMENAAPTPAELANNDVPATAGAPAVGPANQITLTFSFEEAEALNRWLLKPSQDGALAADDAAVHPAMMKIRSAVEHTQAITAVRHELEQAGVPTQHLSDQQVAQLGRRISQAAPRLTATPPA